MLALIQDLRGNQRTAEGIFLPEVHSLHTNRAVPHALESALLLRSTGFGAREAEALGTRPAEWRRGIAERKASVVHEAESHARRHGGS